MDEKIAVLKSPEPCLRLRLTADYPACGCLRLTNSVTLLPLPPRAAAADLPPSECTAGCASWADVLQDGVTNMTQSAVDALFATGSVPATAGSHCIMPGASPVHNEGRRLLLHGEEEDSWLWEAAGRGKPPKRSCDNELSGK